MSQPVPGLSQGIWDTETIDFTWFTGLSRSNLRKNRKVHQVCHKIRVNGLFDRDLAFLMTARTWPNGWDKLEKFQPQIYAEGAD